jgi:RNA polymerase sigma-70 factor (ECF subfamily)
VGEPVAGIELSAAAASGSGAAAAESPDEALLVEGLRAGEQEAYETLLARYQQPVFNLVYRLLEDSAEACDVVQEVFLKVFRHIGSFRSQSSLKTWIYRIAVNEAHNHRRWFNRHSKREVGLDQQEEDSGRSYRNVLPDPGLSPYEQALGMETRTLIEEALSKINAVFREAVVLRDIEDLSYEEIAEILNISLGTVKSRILRGREALRKQLLERMERAGAITWQPQPAGE